MTDITRFVAYGLTLVMVVLIGCGDDDSNGLNSNDAPLDLTADEASNTPNDITDSPEGEDGDQVSDAVMNEAIEDDSTAEIDTSASTLLTFMPLAASGDVVEYVELERYLGTWYEIATTPSFQQAACTNTQAEYTFNDEEGWVDVVNSCRAGGADGRSQRIQGRAELVDTETQAKLAVVFFNQRAPYWVVALDGSEGSAPYEWAVVSVPGSQTMWILSRTPQISDVQRQEIDAHLQSRSFPIERLIDTPQVR